MDKKDKQILVELINQEIKKIDSEIKRLENKKIKLQTGVTIVE